MKLAARLDSPAMSNEPDPHDASTSDPAPSPAPRRRTYRDRVLDKIGRYTADDREALLEFRSLVYSADSFLAREEYVRWLFETDNGLGEGPGRLWIYRVDDAVEGMFAGLQTSLRVDGADVSAAWGTDLFVNPTHKLRGVGAIIVEEGNAATDVTIGIEVSDEASQAFIRAGWTELGEVPLYVHPLDLVRATAGGNFDSQPTWLLKAANPIWRSVDGVRAAVRRRRGIRLEPIDRFDERADQIWERHARHYPVIGRRDAATLNWRFIEFPKDDFYRPFYVYQGDELLGYVVLRLAQHGQHRAGYVVDFLCAPDRLRTVLGMSVEHFRSEDAELLYCMHPGGGVLHRQFQWAGFLVHTTGFRLMALTESLPQHQRDTIADQERWHITYADSNTDYPRTGTVYPSSE